MPGPNSSRLLGATIWLGLGACGDPPRPEAPPPAPAAEEPVAQKSPPTQEAGLLEAVVDGVPVSFSRLPPDDNAMLLLPAQGIARLSVTGETGGPGGFPRLQLFLFGVRPDQLSLPAELAVGSSEGRQVEIRYWPANDQQYWTPSGAGHVRITALDGNTLSGTFEGSLEGKEPGNVVRVTDGRFRVRISARAYGPRPAAAGASPGPGP